MPLLAGEPFCEKPPLTYWVAAAAIRLFGSGAWSARLPNLLYALVTAVGVGWLARRAAGPVAGLIAAAAIGTFLLSYQVVIWLATDAPLLASTAVALAGAYEGLYARSRWRRLGAYTVMHLALALGFLSKSAAAWIVPALALLTMVIWERRARELCRWELYPGLGVQALVILIWIWFVYAGADGPEHLRVFLWNNLAGRFVHLDAPQELQYAAAHRNSPGKYFLELPVYLWPWTLLVAAALRRAWLRRRAGFEELRPVRFALASALPALALLSVAATARNIYLAPALPGFALLLGWWGGHTQSEFDRWDIRALRATAALLLVAVLVLATALALVAADTGTPSAAGGGYGWSGAFLISGPGLIAAAALLLHGSAAARDGAPRPAQLALLLGYCLLLTAPASQLYRRVDAWQNLAGLGRAIEWDARGKPLILMAPDETTRALIDLYARTEVGLVKGPIDPRSIAELKERVAQEPQARVLVQLPGRALTPLFRRIAARLAIAQAAGSPIDEPDWAPSAQLHTARLFALPNGRRYALLEGGR